MRSALVKMHAVNAGVLSEENPRSYAFQYNADYQGPAISLIMPVRSVPYTFEGFPPFFEGLLPEGVQLEGLLKVHKIDKNDYFKQLVATGADLVGAVTVVSLEQSDE